MGFLKKIFKPVAKVLDKVIPNEIKPALPYLAAFAPVFGPTAGMFGSTIGKRMLLSGGANILGQLSQEGNEGDINLLSAGLGALTGAMTTPGADFSGMTTKGTLADQGIIGSQARTEMANRTLLTKAKDLGLESLAKGADLLRPGGSVPELFSKEGAKAALLPASTATGDVMQAEARRLEKQAAIDDALAAAELIEDSGARAEAIRNAMLSYGFFTDDEIEDTIFSAGYRAGGRVGFMFGSPDDPKLTEYLMEKMKEKESNEKESPGGIGALGREMQGREGESEDLDLMTIKATLNQVHTNNDYGEGGGMAAVIEFMEKNPEYKVQVRENIIGDQGNKIMVAPIEKSPVNILDQDGIKTITVGDGIELIMPENKAKGGRIGAEEGGLMNLGGKEMDLRGGGFVPIGKKERADDVPARLSKNEFVMTADAVRAAGGGSVNKGAKRMYDLMNNLEARV